MIEQSQINITAWREKLGQSATVYRFCWFEVIQERFEYAICTMCQNVNVRKLCFDKFVVNIHTRCSFGGSKRIERVYRRVSTQKSQNITVCIPMASGEVLVHYEITQSCMTREKVAFFSQKYILSCPQFLE